ncbi:helix-turn-helix domain-containing protein [Alicyclobacillus sp. SO9]|uniref:helix-turn-helix domain-containing protein n=1 Tax=Alicyclobacillus sp. SO9 TaxID=2665646 RepID=UPI0018E86D7E|nr:helix-turn-helix transcriptional regulator [Alicyclobacillus sp. SO9]
MLGERLRSARERARKTQADAARHLGITRPAYSQYEAGRRDPDTESVRKLAELFNVSTDYLLNRTNHNIGPEPENNPMGIQLTDKQVTLLREIRDDPEWLGMFYDFANATDEEKRMMLDIWASIRKSIKHSHDN